MAFDAEFEQNIENVYKRQVLDNMRFTGINAEATAVNRYADNNAHHGAAIQSFRNSMGGPTGDPQEAASRMAIGQALEPQIAAQHNYFGGIAEGQYKQFVELQNANQGAQMGYLDFIKNDNSLRYQTDAEMEEIKSAYDERMAEAARRAAEKAARDAEEDEAYGGMFGAGSGGDFQFTNDYKTAGRDLLGWSQEEAATYGTDANAMQISGMARSLYNQGASWSETVGNIDSWLASGNIPQSERAKYIAMFQAMYGPSWGQAIDPVGTTSRGNAASWAVDYSNMTPKEQLYVGGNAGRSPTQPWKSNATGGVFGKAKNAILGRGR